MALVYLLGFAVVCYGWGRLVAAYAYPQSRLPIAFQIALGMAGLNFAGGILNALHGARAEALYGLALVGVASVVIGGCWTVSRHGGMRRWWLEARAELGRSLVSETFLGVWFPAAVVAIIILFLAANLMPAGAFNIGDDFHYYLVRPVRMLATGTLGGNPFDCLGLDTLGSQAFFHAFVLVGCPFPYLNGFDAVFCFGILAFLLLEVNRELKLHWGFGLLAVLTMGFIHPQCVNISSHYSGSLMIAGLFLAGWHRVNGRPASGASRGWPEHLPVALFLATLITLKSTLALFACTWTVLFFSLQIMAADHWKKMAKITLTTVAAAAVAVLPWLLTSLPNYVKAYQLAAPFPGAASLANKYPAIAAHEIRDLFTGQLVFYGGRPQDYLLIVFLMLGMGLISLWLWRRTQNAAERERLGLLGAFSLAAVGLFFLNASLFTADLGVRYSCPILIGVFPATALAWVRCFSRDSEPIAGSPGWSRMGLLPAAIVPLLQLVILCLFLPAAATRVDTVLQTRTILSYPMDEPLLRYNQYVISGQESARIRKMQAAMDPQATFLAWTGLSFEFDFRRNRVFPMSEPGILNPWFRFPVGVPEQMLVDYLRSWGIRYIVFEGRGPAVPAMIELRSMLAEKPAVYRKIGFYSIYVRQTLTSLALKSPVLYADERFVVYDINDRTPNSMPR